jgi:hypothetical protein
VSDYVVSNVNGATITELAGVVLTPAVPPSVTMRQARQALYLAGKLSAVDTAIAAISDPTQQQLASLWWNYSNEVFRDNPLVSSLGAAIGLQPADIDQLFVTARTL